MTDTLLRDSPPCPDESVLHDLADGVLPPAADEAARAHLARCARCAAMHARILALRARARALPRELTPPAALWRELQPRLEGAIVPMRVARERWWRRPSVLAVAASILMVFSSAATVLVMRARDSTSMAAGPFASTTTVLQPAEAGTLAAIELLTRELDRRREELSPETIAAVERSLDIVDQALAEARGALARDPRNPTLSELVATAYRHKLTVLRRATELAPRS